MPSLSLRAVAYAALGVLCTLPFWIHPGACPFGLHDWAYPCFAEQSKSYIASLVAPWWDTDLGHIHPLPQITAPWIILGALVSISPAIGLRIFLVAAFAAAGFAADVAAQRLFGATDPWARAIAGILYASSPFFATKLVSGHLGFIACAPLVPAALVAFDAVPRAGVRAWAAAALCAIAAFAQLQVGLVVIALLPPFALARRIPARAWLAVWIAAALAWAPAAYAALSAFNDGVFAPEAQLATWLALKAVPWSHALDGTAYFTGYFQLAAPWQSFDAWRFIAPVCVVAALIRAGAGRVLAIAAIALGAFATGTTGPLGAPIAWTMRHIPAATIFREGYDLLFLAPLVVAGGAAIAVDSIAHWTGRFAVPTRIAVSAACVSVVAVLAAPTVLGRPAALVPLTDTAPLARDARAAAAIPGDDRILWLPATSPLGPIGTLGGADPYQVPIGAHPDASAFHPTGVLALATAEADRGSTLTPALLDRLDVTAVIDRTGVASDRLAAAAHPQGGIVTPRSMTMTARPVSVLALAAGKPSCELDVRGPMASDERAYVRCDSAWSVDPQEATDSIADDPQREWVQGERWALLDPQLAQPRRPVLFTRSARLYSWRSPAAGATWFYAPAGAVIDGRRFGPSDGWAVIDVGRGPHSIRGPGGAIVALSSTIPEIDVIPLHHAFETSISPSRSDRYLGRFDALLPPHGSAIVILREGWSRHWRAWIDGRDAGDPVIADGYATGWRLPPSPTTTHLAIRLDITPPYLALLLFSWTLTAVLACVAGAWPSGAATDRRPK